MAIDVFVSAGRTATDQQERFVTAVERLLTDSGLTPRRAQWSTVEPLKKVEEVMASCCGAVIIAYERLYADDAVELRGGRKPGQIAPLRLPTVWNQIEAALSYSRGLPLLVIFEEGLRSEGVLEKYDWYLQATTIDPQEVDSRDFRGRFDDWKGRVEKVYTARATEVPRKGPISLADQSIGELLGALKPGQIWGVVGAVGGLVTAAAAGGFWLGNHLHP